MSRQAGVFGALVAVAATLALAATAEAADQIAYSCRNDICIIDPDSGGATNLTQSSGSIELWPSWSRDGTKIALQSNATSLGWYDVFAINVADTPPVAGLNVSQTDDYNDNSEPPAWSPDGTRIAFSAERISGGSGNHVLIGSADGTATPVDVNPSGAEYHPTWSPDGSRLAFQRSGGVYTVPVPSGSSTPAYLPGSSGIYPEWSPDGTRIAMVQDDPSSLYSLIHVVRADGSGTFVNLPITASNQDRLSWSPDSTRIAYIDSTNKVRVAPADGSGAGVVIPAPASVIVPHNVSFSPDGTRVAFDAYTDASYRDILIAPANGSAPAHAITANPGEDLDPVWKPGPGGTTPPTDPPPPTRPPEQVQFSTFQRLNIRNNHMLLASVSCSGGPTPTAIAAGCNFDGTAKAKVWQRAGAKRAKQVKFANGTLHLDDGESAAFPLKLTKAGKKLLKPKAKLKITVSVTLTRPDVETTTETKTVKYKVPKKGV